MQTSKQHMGEFDFTCVKCGAGGGQDEFYNKPCSATVLVDGKETTIRGVYNMYGKILANKDGILPYEYDGGCHYEPRRPDYDPKAPKEVVNYLRDHWKKQCIPTEEFLLSEFEQHFDAWHAKDTDLVAFNVTCEECSGGGFMPLPPLDQLETVAGFRKRRDKMASHASLQKTSELKKKAECDLKRNQEALTEAKKAFERAQAAVHKSEAALANTDEAVSKARSLFEAFGPEVSLVHEEEPPKKRQRAFLRRPAW